MNTFHFDVVNLSVRLRWFFLSILAERVATSISNESIDIGLSNSPVKRIVSSCVNRTHSSRPKLRRLVADTSTSHHMIAQTAVNIFNYAIGSMQRSLQFLLSSQGSKSLELAKYLTRGIHTTAVKETFWERDKKSGYSGGLQPVTKKQLILDGLKELKEEISLWKEELKEKFEGDPVLVYRPGEVDIVWKFDNKSILDKWVVTTDSDHNEGNSTAKLEISESGYGVFHGNVSSKVLKDGKIKRTGYANMRTKRVRKSFKRESTYDWTPYNTIVLKVRGDGRSYLINLHTEGYFDLLWNDTYHFVLYTRGGPHWQIAKIPFSKFFFSSKGRVQDKQHPIVLDRVTHIGFSAGAKGGYDGPFHLEFDYIGLEFDPTHVETFAYEMYKQDKYIVAT